MGFAFFCPSSLQLCFSPFDFITRTLKASTVRLFDKLFSSEASFPPPSPWDQSDVRLFIYFFYCHLCATSFGPFLAAAAASSLEDESLTRASSDCFPQGQHVDDTWVVFILRWLPSSLPLSSFQLLSLYFFQRFFLPPSKCCSLPLKINHKYPERRLLVAESCGALAPYLPVRTLCAHRIKTGFEGTNKTQLELTVSVRPACCACRRRSVAPWCCPCCSRCSLRIRLTWSGRLWSRVWVSSWVTLMTLTSIPRYVCLDRKASLC